MVLKPDQQRVCTMLKDTITLLCKNGLNFKSKFCIEAVIGVTLDDDDMFHISMSEIIKSATPPQQSDQSDSDSASSDAAQYRHKRKRKKQMSVKRENDRSGPSDNEGDGANESDTDTINLSNPAKRPAIKGEPEDEDDNSGDIVFVKQEIDENWSQNTSNFPDFSNISGSQQDQNFASLSDMTLTPVTGNNDNGQWLPHGPQHMQPQYGSSTPRMQRTATVTGSQMGDTSLQGSDQSMQQSPITSGMHHKRFRCNYCTKSYTYQVSLQRHQKTAHMGIYPHTCEICGKGFITKEHLTGHMSLHTGMGDFRCSVCSAVFNWKPALDRHIKKQHSTS